MSDDAGAPDAGLTRRGFLGMAALGAVALAACSDDGDDASSGDPGGGSSTSTSGAGSGPALDTDPFKLGVASGDPLPDAVVLWTRLAPAPLDGGLAGMPDSDVEVSWEIALDDAFAEVVGSGTATARPADAHSVHVDATGLAPATDHWYRFTAGGFTSPVGRTRTAPAAGEATDRLRLGVVTCQDFGTGYYAAYRHLLDEDLDAVLHLGDYIYEHILGAGDRAPVPPHETVSLDDYRMRHAQVKGDADLQAAHARYPFVCMWDDHEVANNYAGDTLPGGVASDEVLARRTAAYRAWWEHLPVRMPAPDGPDLEVHRSLVFGDLARLTVLDERQYADEPPCRDVVTGDAGDCAARTDDREYLGEAQQAWFAETVAEPGVVWDLVGNPAVVCGINAGTDATPRWWLETWDGYPAARRRFLEALAASAGQPVVLTGDYHAAMVADVHLDPEDRTTAVVAPELMTPAISSIPFTLPLDANPHVRHAVERHGYLTVEVTPEAVVAEIRILDDVADPASAIATDSRWRVAAGTPTAEREA